jgi:DNA-damage-inducible protein J
LTFLVDRGIIKYTKDIVLYVICIELKQEEKKMAEQVLIQFRVDKELKQDVAEICDALGTDMPTVFRMCMKQIKIARGIPFSTRLPESIVTRAEAMEAFEEMRKQAADVPEMSLEEINEEIRATRADRKAREAANK